MGKKLALLLSTFILTLTLKGAIPLSSNAEISILTMGPDQAELYSAFWHSAIRVKDTANRIDWVYNYGIFDFDNPDFYSDFAKGYLNYKLGVSDFSRFYGYYAYQGRSMEEQILDLDPLQKQKIFDFLEITRLPENQYYLYDYFFNNCATKIRDVIEDQLDGKLEFDPSYVSTQLSFRKLVDLCIEYQPWGDFGIDLCLGSPIDEIATPYEYMFLPFYIRDGFANAHIEAGKQRKPIVKETRILIIPENKPIPAPVFTPHLLFWGFFVLIGLATLWEFKKKVYRKWVDITWFGVVGLIGVILFLIWVATDHHAAARNYNLLWALPFHFLAAILLIPKDPFPLLRFYFLGAGVFMILLLLGWNVIPQSYHTAFLPIILTLSLRSFWIFNMLK